MSSQGLSWTVCFADTFVDSEYADTASESGLSRGSLGGRRHGRTAKRKRESSSPVSITRKKRRSARGCQAVRDSHHDSESEDSMVESALRGTELRQIRIDEAAEYYDKTFRSINQLCCKDILKAWIRVSHQRKQSTHPYNGGKEKKVSKEKEEYIYNGNLKKPDYWPCDADWESKGVRHTEPDHLYKRGLSFYQLAPIFVLTSFLERLKLLPHLLQYTNKVSTDANFSLEKMIKSTESIHLDGDSKKHWKPEYLERLKEIYWVRGKEMQYEKEEIGDCHSSWRRFFHCANTASDGDTLVHVHMPKPRGSIRKGRKARNSAAKTVKPSSKRARNEPEQSNKSVRKAPVANMCIDPQSKDGKMGEIETSKPSIHTGSSPLIEEVTPEVSCCETTMCNSNASTILNSQTREDRRQNSVEENWTMRSTNFRRDPAVSTNPSFPMQTSYSQLGCQQNGQAAWQQVPIRTRLNESLTRSAPAHPVTPEVENVRYPAFAASSSGLVGYPGWQTEEYLNPQGTSSVYTADANPNPSLLPYTYGSFSSDYSYSNPPSGPQFNTWNDESQTVMSPYDQNLDEEQQQRFGTPAVGIPQYSYQRLGMATPSAGNQDLANQSLQHTNFGIRNSSSGTEHSFNPFSRGQRQL